MQPQVVIEVSGGLVRNIFSEEPVTVILVDWDNIAEGEGAVTLYSDPNTLMSPATKKCVKEAK